MKVAWQPSLNITVEYRQYSVYSFDLPNDGDTYVHIGGRAGRLGRLGKVMSLISADQEFVLERLATKLSLDLKCVARQEGKGRAKKKVS